MSTLTSDIDLMPFSASMNEIASRLLSSKYL